jgi:hypothetical protein
MKRITSLEELKKESSSTDGTFSDFFIQLNFGAKSSKRILYNPDCFTFDVYNEIDGSYQEDLTEKKLSEETHIVEAIALGALYNYDFK